MTFRLVRVRLWVIAALLVMLSRPIAAGAGAAPITVAHLSAPLPLDATLSDPAWAALPWVNGFTDLTSRADSAGDTSAAMATDGKILYVGFRCLQSGAPTATQATNAVGFGLDDFVGIGIDVSGNGERAYYFETTPNGTRYQQANESSRFAPEWTAVTARTAVGWNAILAIPLSDLQLSASGAQHWRVNFIRAIAATSSHFSYAYDPLMGDAPVPQWPGFRDARWWLGADGVVVQGSASQKKPRFEPYLLAGAGSGRNIYVDAAGNESPRNERHAGIDLAVPLTPTVAAVASLNPDFSNVEIDQQTIAPQQFARNLVEARPFFAQGAAYINAARTGYQFNLPLDSLFYSPSIGPFDRGIKVEGTSGNRSFGVLEARGSDPTFDDIAFGLTHRRPNSTFAYWTDGAFANQANGNDRAIEAGAFGRSLASGLVYSMQYGREWGSFVNNVNDAQQFRAFLDFQRGGNWGVSESAVSFISIGPQYAPAIGFTNIADVRGPEFFTDITRNFKNSRLKNVEVYVNADRWIDSLGYAHLSDTDLFVTLRTNHALRFIYGNANSSQRSYNGNSYTGGFNDYDNPVTLPFRQQSIEAVVGDGTSNSLDYTYSAGPFNGPYTNNFTILGTKELPGHLSLSLQYSGNVERPLSGPENSQWLRRVALGIPMGTNGNASVALRTINGTGGFASPGINFAASLRHRFRNGAELYVDWGAPAASTTVDRLIVKYILRINGGLTG